MLSYITSQEVQIKSTVTANHSTQNLATINVLKRFLPEVIHLRFGFHNVI